MRKYKAIFFDLNGVLILRREGRRVLNLELINLIKNLKEKSYKTGLISNTINRNMREAIKKRFNLDIKEIFNVVVLSIEVGVCKPNKRIFELALKQAGVKPEEAIFIDNSRRHLKKAGKIGIKAILFNGNKDLKKKLVGLGVL